MQESWNICKTCCQTGVLIDLNDDGSCTNCELGDLENNKQETLREHQITNESKYTPQSSTVNTLIEPNGHESISDCTLILDYSYIMTEPGSDCKIHFDLKEDVHQKFNSGITLNWSAKRNEQSICNGQKHLSKSSSDFTFNSGTHQGATTIYITLDLSFTHQQQTYIAQISTTFTKSSNNKINIKVDNNVTESLGHRDGINQTQQIHIDGGSPNTNKRETGVAKFQILPHHPINNQIHIILNNHSYFFQVKTLKAGDEIYLGGKSRGAPDYCFYDGADGNCYLNKTNHSLNWISTQQFKLGKGQANGVFNLTLNKPGSQTSLNNAKLTQAVVLKDMDEIMVRGYVVHANIQNNCLFFSRHLPVPNKAALNLANAAYIQNMGKMNDANIFEAHEQGGTLFIGDNIGDSFTHNQSGVTFVRTALGYKIEKQGRSFDIKHDKKYKLNFKNQGWIASETTQN